ncbi:class I adenylate cyclase [Shigella flexneri]
MNRQISPDLLEPNLTFIYVPPGRANRTGWYLYTRRAKHGFDHQPSAAGI